MEVKSMARRGRTAASLALSIAFLGGGAQAQSVSPQCSQIFTQDACQKTIDLFEYMAPQLGTVIAGGSPVLGQIPLLSRAGSNRTAAPFSLGVRVNLLLASIPRVDQIAFSITGASNTDAIRVDDRLVPGPGIDAALGIFNGFSIGTSRILAVDLLGSAFYLPDVNEEGIRVDARRNPLRFGLGARVGLLEESIITPALTLSFLRRELPTVDITATSAQGANDVGVAVEGLEKRTDSWRIALGKSFVGFQLAVGGGQDIYDSSALVTSTVNGLTVGPIRIGQEVTRTNVFVDLGVSLGPARLGLELGRVFGGRIETYNRFADPAPDAARTYGALGARLSL